MTVQNHNFILRYLLSFLIYDYSTHLFYKTFFFCPLSLGHVSEITTIYKTEKNMTPQTTFQSTTLSYKTLHKNETGSRSKYTPRSRCVDAYVGRINTGPLTSLQSRPQPNVNEMYVPR